jgi:hypothetical protein
MAMPSIVCINQNRHCCRSAQWRGHPGLGKVRRALNSLRLLTGADAQPVEAARMKGYRKPMAPCRPRLQEDAVGAGHTQ